MYVLFTLSYTILFCRGHADVWIGVMDEYVFTDGSTYDYHEFNFKSARGECLHVHGVENRVSSENCQVDKQYICQSLQYMGKNLIKSPSLPLR